VALENFIHGDNDTNCYWRDYRGQRCVINPTRKKWRIWWQRDNAALGRRQGW
jgi:hypothetical protein